MIDSKNMNTVLKSEVKNRDLLKKYDKNIGQ